MFELFMGVVRIIVSRDKHVPTRVFFADSAIARAALLARSVQYLLPFCSPVVCACGQHPLVFPGTYIVHQYGRCSVYRRILTCFWCTGIAIVV